MSGTAAEFPCEGAGLQVHRTICSKVYKDHCLLLAQDTTRKDTEAVVHRRELERVNRAPGIWMIKTDSC